MAVIESNRHIVQVYVGALSSQYEALSVEASKQTSSEEIVSCIADKLNLNDSTGGAYELAEVVLEDVDGGECKERRLGANESPVAVMCLWPKNNKTGQLNRFYLREKMTDALWMENFSVDPQLIKDYFQRFLYQPKDREYPDLCQLPDLNEQTLLDNLRARFAAGYIYTYVGSILIAVNPFKFHPIYNPKYVKLYQNKRIGSSLPPHIFAVADTAYHCMLKERTNQCIVISGESGSGKTESTNFLLHHLTALSQKGSHGSGVEQTILSAGPVLEAFGNAKTAHNNNSSRFGKFIQVNYKENGMVYGAVVQKYLLEKSRICSQGRNERNYHVFYYLLAGASDQERQQLHLLSVDKYNYLSKNGTCVVPGADEKYEFSRLTQSMEMVGFTADKQRRLFAVLSAVLLLGNVEFQPRKSYHHDEAVSVKNPEIVALISELLRVKQETLLAALTAKKARASGETLVINYRMPGAMATRDAMAKCLYGALFDWIVMQVNHALLSKKDTFREHQGHSIGVLDIFGFEDFGPCNSFEQLCINYANEHLQNYFNQHVFKYEQEEYRREGIRWTDIGFSDNTECLQLIEGKPSGLLCLLDDQCNFPGATNETLLQKFNSVHKGNTQFYEKPQRKEPAFIVRHYAGTVKYQVTNMREKNLDLMRQDIVGVLKNSSLAFVRELVGADPVAVFRWAIVRAFFRAYFAFHEAGRKHRINRVDGASRLPRASIHTPNESIISHLVTVSSINLAINRIAMSKYLHGGEYHSPYRQYNESVHRIDGKTVKCSQWGTTSPSRAGSIYSARPPSTGRHSDDVKLERVYSNASDVMHRANQIVMKNKSFRPRERSKKGLKNLQSVKTLAGRTGGGSGGGGGNAAGGKGGRKQPLTVAAQFQHSLHSLMDTLNQANPFFIRCIKSNGDKIPNAFDDETVQRQLRYTGMLETVRIRQAGYNVRLTYEEFIQLYRILLPKGLLSSQSDVRHFLATLNLNRDNYQLGATKIFMRESEQTKLDFRLHQQIMASIITIQRWFRAVLERRRFLALRKAALIIQNQFRLWAEVRTDAAQRLQSWWRGLRERRAFLTLKQIVLALQCYARGFLLRRRVKSLKESRRKKLPIIQPPNRTAMEKDDMFTSRHPSIEQLCDAFNNEVSILLKDDQKREDELTRRLRATVSLPSHSPEEVISSSESIVDIRTTQSYSKRKVAKTQNMSELALKHVESSTSPAESLSVVDSLSDLPGANFAKCQPRKELEEGGKLFSPVTSKITTQDVANELIWLRLDQNNLTGEIKRKVSPTERAFTKTTTSEQRSDPTVRSQHEITAKTLDDQQDPPKPDVDTRLLAQDLNTTIDAILSENNNSTTKKAPTKIMYLRSSSTTVLEPVHSTCLVSLRPVRRDPRLQEPSAAVKKETKMEHGMPRQNAVANEAEPLISAHAPAYSTITSASLEETPLPLRKAVIVPEPPARTVRRLRKDGGEETDSNYPATADGKSLRVMSELNNRKHIMLALKASNVGTKRKSTSQLPQDLRRRNSDPTTAAKLGEIVSPNPRGRTNNNVEFIGTTANGVFEIAGHKFRKWSRFSKEDRCTFCHDTMDAFVTQCQRCLDCKQLYHTKCIQNKGVCSMPCSGPQVAGGRGPKHPKRHRAPEPVKHPVQSKFSLTGTSEFTDRTDKIISDAKELQLMQDFITKKIYKMESEEMKKQSEVDRVFKHALREFKDNLVATYSVVNKQGSALKYKDLIANFLHVMETVCQRQGGQAETFPVTMGVNAFRGFMDEFMTSRQDVEKTRTKRKKDKKRKMDDQITFAGHTFVLSMINIPTECEICKTFFMWPLERSLICQTCKLVSHKKCYMKVTTYCRLRGAGGAASIVGTVGPGSTHPSHPISGAIGRTVRRPRVFGLPLSELSTGDGKVPVVVDRLITTIELYGLYTEGLYRKSGVSSKVKELKLLLDELPEDTIKNLENYQVHVLTSVLKSFFRDMPEPLLTFDFYDDFIMAARLTDLQERVATLFGILKKLPKPNFDLMERLIFHLARVALHEDSNRMGANALAIVFAPCILRTNKIQPAQDSLHDIASQTLCVETILVEKYKTVRTTLADIATLDTACHTATHRLSSLRCSKVFTPEELNPNSNMQTATAAPEEEVALLVGHIHDIKKEKAILTSALPSLTRATSEDDLLSTDLDGECGSLDDLSQTVVTSGHGRGVGALNAQRALQRQVSSDDPIMV